ncbi:MAG: hypothetical protein BMS9Abin05_0239 [Rhodothermia bacterium]|nr:MAG: hypothetical protein BMS9Abin05_0239 [Rhodothermia bacterium]
MHRGIGYAVLLIRVDSSSLGEPLFLKNYALEAYPESNLFAKGTRFSNYFS